MSSARRRSGALLVLLVALGAAAPGCGYTVGYKAAKGIRTVAVPIASNATLRRGIELQLTDLIRDEILIKTPIAIESVESADAVLELDITTVTERVLVEDQNDAVLQSSVTVGLIVTLRDQRDGTILIDKLLIQPETAEFVIGRGETRETATDEALQDLAERVVFLLEEPWGGG